MFNTFNKNKNKLAYLLLPLIMLQGCSKSMHQHGMHEQVSRNNDDTINFNFNEIENIVNSVANTSAESLKKEKEEKLRMLENQLTNDLDTSSPDYAKNAQHLKSALIKAIISCAMIADKQKMKYKKYSPAQLFRIHLKEIVDPQKIDLVDSKHIHSLFSYIDAKDANGMQDAANAIIDIMFNPKNMCAFSAVADIIC